MPNLSDTEVTAISGVAAALVGAAVALISVFLTNRANAKSTRAARDHELCIRQQDLLRSRGEELYTLFESWLNLLVGYYFIKSSVMSGKLTYNEALDLEIKRNNESSGDHVRIEMLIDVYFPDLREAYDKVIGVREQANDIVSEHKAQYGTGNTDGRSFLRQLLMKQGELEECATTFKGQLLRALRDA